MEDLVAKVAGAVKILNADPKTSVDIVFYNGPIDETGYRLVVRETARRSSDTVLMLLVTPGGGADAAYRIARLLSQRYATFRLLVASMCKSAGTLVAIGASELVMADTGELGPLDVQIRKRDELLQRESGLELVQGLQHLTGAAIDAFREMFLEVASGTGLSTRLCADIVSGLVGQLYGNIYSQIDPIRLGSVVRANAISMHYGELLGTKNLKPDALARLVLGYPSHDFVIDRGQAEQLFQCVRPPTPGEEALIASVEPLLTLQYDTHDVLRLDTLGASHGTANQQLPPEPPGDGTPPGSGAAPAIGSEPIEPHDQQVTRGAIVPTPGAPLPKVGA